MKSLEEFTLSSKYFFAAHRGASGNAPENTFAAVELALNCGASMVELDLQKTKDGKFIVFHDETLGRTTNGSGKISNFTWDEIKNLDAGSWYSEKFAGEKIPLLADMLEYLGDKAYLNLEIKPKACFEKEEDAIFEIIKIIKDANFQEKALVASFDYDALKLIKRIEPKFHTAAIKIPGDKRTLSDVISETKCEAIVCSERELSKKLSKEAQNLGIYIGVYGIDDEKALEKCVNYEVKAIATNYPADIIPLAKNKYPDFF